MSREHQLVLAYFLKSERLNQKRLYTILFGPSNNHFEVLNDLKQAGLIFEHLSASSEQSPVFVLDQELTLQDFTEQIEKQIGQPLAGLDETQKSVLNIIYRYNHYNEQSVKPNLITPELYQQLHGKAIVPTTYESLGRRVRKVCGELLKLGYLVKMNDKSYGINSH
jgi:hypothetical protein